jgi:16S rRNA (guanine527-N7)-methyltransferase
MSTQGSGQSESLPLETIAATLAPFRVNLSDSQLQAIQRYVNLLLEWNKSINLTAIEDRIEIVSRHFGESLFSASFLNFSQCRLADVGTGAGFPGLALKIACPAVDLTLFESNAKKCAFLTEISQRLGFTGVDIKRERYEDFKATGREFDFVAARALGDYPVFLPWARSVLRPEGRVLLWLGTDESIRIGRRQEFIWDAPVLIPESRRRVILAGRSAI